MVMHVFENVAINVNFADGIPRAVARIPEGGAVLAIVHTLRICKVWHIRFLRQSYAISLSKDLDAACAGRLKTWRATLQSTVEDTMPSFLRLEDESRNLAVRLILGLRLTPASPKLSALNARAKAFGLGLCSNAV